MLSKVYSIILLVVLQLASAAIATAGEVRSFDHAPWNALLGAAVRPADGRVDYTRMKADPRLSAYVAALAAFDPEGLSGRNEKLAFWINAYNALAVQGVTAHWPGLKSVADVAPDFGFFKARSHTVGGRLLSLDTIEHEIIRKQFAEPRIHAALNCASVSCPPLRNEAYVADRLDAQLDAQFRAFVRDPGRNRIDVASGAVALSSLFDWFKADFGGVAGYIGRYLDAPAAAAVSEAEKAGRLTYLPYDWALNAQ
jgi:hypothetical protein